MSFLAAALSFSIIPIAEPPRSLADPCAAFDSSPGLRGERGMTAEDLVQLADIGRADPNETQSAFGLSPDMTQIAFAVRRGNAETNTYCQRLMVMPLDGSRAPRELDRGGEYLRDDFRLREFSSVTAGWVKVNTPRFSPDGRAIAYLKRTGGSTQVWLADSSGGTDARQITTLPDDVDAFAWLGGGDSIIVATRPGIRDAALEIARQARRGFLYDESISPQFTSRPIPRGAVATQYTTVDLATGETRGATEEEIAVLVPAAREDLPERARGYIDGPDGWAAWLEPKYPDRYISPTRLVLTDPSGNRITCSQASCEGIMRMWWSSSERALFAVQKTGWGQSRMGILRWDIGASVPRRLMVSDDMLIGCALATEEIICAREGATTPRQLVGIGLDSGEARLIHDPNPLVSSLDLGSVQRFRFRNDYGVESYADLVLPPDHEPGQRHPLVVVQYISHGFLRGGSGDEVPIQPLAARGFAVLSFAKPDLVPAVAQAQTATELLSANRVDWLDRRNVQSSLDIALDRAIGTGAVDADRMGLTGWSDGVSSAQFALINSPRYKVASLGSCCEDMYSYVLSAGPAYSAFTRSIGYRFFEEGAEEFWRPMSLILNVDRVDVPILIQNADSEYEGGLDVVEVYRAEGKPIELHVFEDETHYKWQPAHRNAVYERTTEWLEFWLMKRRNCDPARDQQYDRWLTMEGAPSRAQLACSPQS